MRTRASAIVTVDRWGNRAYVWPDGVSIARDGYGRMAWSLYLGAGPVADFWADTLGECLANI